MLAGLLHVSAASNAQTITLKGKNMPLQQALNAIRIQAGYEVAADKSLLQLVGPITISASKVSVEEFLATILRDQPIEAKIEDKTVYLFEKKKILAATDKIKSSPNYQQRTVAGKVTDEEGEPLEGVTVTVIGTGTAVSTDSRGEYSLFVPENGQKILFSIIGYKDAEEAIQDREIINVSLTSSVSDLDEVVVVAFGEQKKASVVGAITTISPKFLQQTQTRSITNSLGGQTSGIISVQRSGEPGHDNSDFWIRGINTFGSNKTPMILIDGIERSLDNISPEEIESFSILKDAAATALYGVRGANGVILVQTKRGKIGKPRITVKSDFGVSRPTQLPDFLDAASYMEVVNEAFENSYLEHIYKPEAIEKTRNGEDPDLFPDVNWLNAVTRKQVPTHRVSFDINGGTELLRYSLVASYHSEEGIIKKDPEVNYDSQLKLKKYNVRTNVDLKLTPSTNVNVSIGGFILNRNAPGVDIPSILSRSFNTPPNYHPPMYSNGQIPQVGARYNPWADAVHSGFNKSYENNIESLIGVSQDVGAFWERLDGLRVDAKFSFDAFTNASLFRTKTPTTYLAYGRDEQGNLLTNMTTQGQEFLGYSRDAGGNRSMYFESKADYNRVFGKHSVGAMVLFYLRDHVVTDASSAIQSLPFRDQGIASRMVYSFRDKYFLEFNIGYNGSENFARSFRFGLFPAVAGGWMVSNEGFFNPLKDGITMFKIRGSYGLVGNDKLGGRRFAYLSTIEGRPGYNFGYAGEYGLGGWGEGDFGIRDLTWETAKKLNVGVDIELFSKLNLNVDYFAETREDIFMQRKTIQEIAGYQNMPWANYGIVKNGGVEANLEYNQSIGRDLFISLRASYTFARNRIVEIDEAESIIGTTRSQTNNPINQTYGLKALGLYQNDDFIDPVNGVLKSDLPQPTFGIVRPGDIRYADLNEDGTIDSYDISAIGKPYVPEVIYGFGFTVRYKRVDIGTFFQGTGNFTNMMSGGTLIPGSGAGGTGNIYANAHNRWTKENPSDDVLWPRLSNNTSENNMRSSTWWLKNSSFLRMKNFELGYRVDRDSWNIGLSMLRVFFRGSNLVTFSPFDMWDPEIGSSDGLRYPLSRIYSFGVDVQF